MSAARERLVPRVAGCEGPAGEGPVPRGARSAGSRSQVIHSGHFMVSSPHGERRGCDFDTVNRRTCRTYRFGPRSRGRLNIDPSLSRLLECMTLAYSGKLVSPKWKTFKGLRLLWRDKIRLNNAIWRAWYTQYVEKRKNPVCGFITPLEGTEADEHRKPEAIVLEGNYWKRKIEVVIKEYHKWRIYFKKRLHKNQDDDLSSLAKEDIIAKSVEKWSSQILQDSVPMEEGDTILCDLEYLLSDISDTLFTMTQETKPWPNAGEVVYTSNADIIQPELAPLQPNLDELMDMQGFFSPHHPHPATSYPEHSHFSNMSSNPFGAGTLTVPAETMLLDSQHPQADVLLDLGLRLGGAIPAAAISNQLLHGSTVPSEIIDSRSAMFSGSRFQSPVYYEQGAGYLLPDQPSCIASYCSTMVSAPSATISEQEPPYCSVPLHNSKSIYGTNVCSSLSAHPAPTPFNQHISTLTFPPSMVLSSPATSPLSSTAPSSDQLVAPLQQVSGFALPKVQSLRSGSRQKHKTVNQEVESSSMLPSTVSAQNLDLIQLASAGKQEAGPLPQFSLSHDTVPPAHCLTSTLSDSPGSIFMKAPQLVLTKPPPQSSISYSVPFIFTKTERLSPGSSCNGKVTSPVTRGGSGQLSLNDSGEPSSATQSPCSTLSRTRPDTNKLALTYKNTSGSETTSWLFDFRWP
uniref:MLX-interacting protein-like n=1 Tax=Pristiophorus japonicus TaxID=55135 RepID=UPI00398E3FE3